MARKAPAEPTRLDDLKALRSLIWASLREAEPDRRAPLVTRLESVIQQIESLTPQAKVGDPIDEVAARRAARGGATSRLGDTAGSAR